MLNYRDFVMYTYNGTRHGFHNNSTPRYNQEQAKIAWERTISFFKKHLSKKHRELKLRITKIELSQDNLFYYSPQSLEVHPLIIFAL